MGETSPPIANSRGKTGRFVLLVQSRTPGPMKLLEGLRKRDAAVRVVHDPASAMVEVAQFNAQVLIVHEPEAIGDLESLLAAVRLYHPGVLCWRHEAGGAGRRENLSPFACKLNQTPAPRFTPAPQSLNQHRPSASQSLQSRPSYSASADTLASSSVESAPQQPVDLQNELQQGRPDFSNIQTSTKPNKQPSHQTNGRHNGHASASTPSQTNGHNKSPAKIDDKRNQHAPLSLGHRLATPLDALDDLTAGPLLSAEEIELLRGPQETDGD